MSNSSYILESAWNEACDNAWRDGQVATRSHLAYVRAGRFSVAELPRLGRFQQTLKEQILPFTARGRHGVDTGNQHPEETSLAVLTRELRARTVAPEAKTAEDRRLFIELLQIGKSLSARDGDLLYFAAAVFESICGSLSNWIESDSGEAPTEPSIPAASALPSMVGRADELHRHASACGLAIQQCRPYLLAGQRGVGKSLFLQHLLAGLAGKEPFPKFEYLSARSYQKKPGVWEEDLILLGQRVLAARSVVPVFDDWDTLLQAQEHLKLLEQTCGAILFSGKSPVIVVGTGDGIQRHPLTNRFRVSLLSSLPLEATRSIVLERAGRIPDLFELAAAPAAGALGVEETANEIIARCRDQYPRAAQPITALDILAGSEMHARYRAQRAGQAAMGLLAADIWEHVALDLGINPELAGQDRKQFFRRLREKMRRDIKGQDHAVKTVCEMLYSQAKQPPRELPRGRFLFVGPPGTGKTELSRSLARHLCSGPEAFHAFAMGQYQGEEARTRFQGAGPGYVGYGETFTIFDAVRQTPACVILLDEIDRAASSIQDLLLSALEGWARDGKGELCSFSQAIFVLTTNQGQEIVENFYREHAAEGSRDGLAGGLDGDSLRRLLENRSLGDRELQMRGFLTDRVQEAREGFGTAESGQERILQIQAYGEYQAALRRLEYDNGKTLLDRALLDRIDSILPFFPLDRHVVFSILGSKLAASGWVNCPRKERLRMLNELMPPGTIGGSGRIDRVIKKALASRDSLD